MNLRNFFSKKKKQPEIIESDYRFSETSRKTIEINDSGIVLEKTVADKFHIHPSILHMRINDENSKCLRKSFDKFNYQLNEYSRIFYLKRRFTI